MIKPSLNASHDSSGATIRVATTLTNDDLDHLAVLLVAVVASGAAVSFLPPLSHADARRYWDRVVAGDAALLVAKRAQRIVGTVQLVPAESANGRHRAEVAKLLVHPDTRRQGIGRQLMERLELLAIADGRTLLVLDTREGDAANALYQSLGYQVAGRIPGFVRSADGHLDTAIFYFKVLDRSRFSSG